MKDMEEKTLQPHPLRSFCDADESSYGSDDDDSDIDDGESQANRSTRTLSNVREDIKIMNVTRGLFILSIITFAVISAQCVFIVTTLHESSNYQVAFAEISDTIIERFYEKMNHTVWYARDIAIGIGVSQITANWPEVTVAHFDALCESAFVLSHAATISFQPKVNEESLLSWEEYAALFYPLSLKGSSSASVSNVTDYFVANRSASDGIYRFENGTSLDVEPNTSIHFPVWQTYPPPQNQNNSGLVATLFDETTNAVRANAILGMTDRNGSTISSFLFQDTNASDVAYYHTPRSNLYFPILSNPDTGDIVGSINFQISWEMFFSGTDLENNETLVVVIENSCGGVFSYKIVGENSYFLGPGKLYDPKVDGNSASEASSYETFASLFDYHGAAPVDMNTFCSYRITPYATSQFKGVFFTSRPNVYMGIVFVGLLFMAGLFLLFDNFVGRHQAKMLQATKQSDAIVRSLFPDAVADRLYEEARKKEEGKANEFESKNRQIRNFMKSPTVPSDDNSENVMGSDPIAELFPNTTVLFADFVGFTAWSSEREPVQVFVLLETIFFAMDKIAKRMNVFKVETIGDCYVAATGLPEPQDDHAERMALFAYRCLAKVKSLTKKLEAQLGPGTAELSMRMGIHSGPITAGVVRGQKARFQLFGDTMNMASRIETTGQKDKIHLSRDTALLLRPQFVVKREDTVTLKGKGEQDTYWFVFHSKSSEGSHSSDRDSYFNSNTTESGPEPDALTEIGAWTGTSLSDILGKTMIDPTTERLVLWNVDTLKPMLCALIAKRAVAALDQSKESDIANIERDALQHEVQVVIEMEKFYAEIAATTALSEEPLPREVETELMAYVSAIASGYPKNPFHSFEHCSHVVMSASKLLKRIVASEDMKEKTNEVVTLKHLHDHTFGIATDPLCQFAVVFSALVHDVGHPGVPNTRLAVEEPLTAEKYSNRSIAEQRSLDVAFDLLNLPNFQNLRKCIYTTESECKRFRQLVVNSILATDIADKDMKALRDSRWDVAFQNSSTEADEDNWMNRKATIVIEHVIQASDVAHTMQHFVIYQKWNERLFQELYFAFRAGRMDKDPSLGWYNGEIWFFDNYIIPLARKLKDCGVFGVSSDEYLHYATQNRREWESKGHTIVEAMVSRAEARYKKMNATAETHPKTAQKEDIMAVDNQC